MIYVAVCKHHLTNDIWISVGSTLVGACGLQTVPSKIPADHHGNEKQETSINLCNILLFYIKKESFEKPQPYVKHLLEHLSSCKQVMVVSSVWHGVHPGYYLGLGSVSAREH